MSRLSEHNLPESTRRFDYDRAAITAGILHFGIGNFHRAHQAVYCDELLNAGDTQWGITGVSLRSSAMRKALKPQDYLYTLAVLGEATEYRIIGAIKLWSCLGESRFPANGIGQLRQSHNDLRFFGVRNYSA